MCTNNASELPIITIDTETGGLDADKNALLSFGIYTPESKDSILNNNCCILNNNYYFKGDYVVVDDDISYPSIGKKNIITTAALRVNHLNVDYLNNNGNNLEYVDEVLSKSLSGTKFRVLGQNLKFDLGFISDRLPLTYKQFMKQRHHMELMDFSMLYHYFIKNPSKKLSLDSMREEFGINSGIAHSSYVDAVDTRKVYDAIVSTIVLR